MQVGSSHATSKFDTNDVMKWRDGFSEVYSTATTPPARQGNPARALIAAFLYHRATLKLMRIRCSSVLIILALGAALACNALTSQQPSSFWHPLPHIGRRDVLSKSAGLVAASTIMGSVNNPVYAATLSNDGSRSVASIASNIVIPVWPTWGGGRVVPVSLGDPFLLLAHHKHWFDPRDPLRKPFQVRNPCE